jgi:hypothetical protein
MNFNKDNSFFVCHRCLHITFLKTDMEKHCNRYRICEAKYNCLLSIQEVNEKSLNKRYYLSNNNVKEIEKYHLINLVNNFNEKINIINNLFHLHKNNQIEDNKIKNNQIEDNKIKNNQIEDNEYDIKKFIIMIDGIKHYKCPDCLTKYKKKENFVNHLKNLIACQNKIALNNAIKNKLENTLNNTNNNHNITQNIQQNTMNNILNQNNYQTNNNNYSMKVNDFIEENYSYDHIPRNLIKNKDFYLYKNFLKYVIENDDNKNLYFDNKYAFFYSDGGLRRIPNDKAGYLVLEKLRTTIELYIHSNPHSINNDYQHINKYYNTMKNKYTVDTIYKPYDPETNTYLYCETKNIRTRDKCLSDITSVFNDCKERTKEIMKDKGFDKKEIDTNFQINIPYYESSKMRNKAFLHDDYKY